jgi:hypothetical protein
MATDGIKIIDGDTAHDTYWGIMDLYDSGADFEKIKKEFPLSQEDFIDEFDNEVYVTSCGLAYWEIGILTDENSKYIKSIIDKGATVTEWIKENEEEGRGRVKELNKFWKKISQPNKKIRGRKKYRKVTNLYFQQADILTFQLKDNNYRAVICSAIDQYRGACNYLFSPTTYNSCKKPNTDDILKSEILGTQIGSGFDQAGTKNQQPGIEKIWNYVGGTCNFFFGLVKIAVPHTDIINFKDKFEKVGTLEIVEGLKQTGMYGYESSFERFETIFSNLDEHVEIFRLKKFPVKVVVDIIPT